MEGEVFFAETIVDYFVLYLFCLVEFVEEGEIGEDFLPGFVVDIVEGCENEVFTYGESAPVAALDHRFIFRTANYSNVAIRKLLILS